MGQQPNDLRDQRDALVRELNTVVRTRVVEGSEGQFDLYIGNGQPLVLGQKSFELKAESSEFDPSQYSVSFDTGNGTVPLSVEQLGGGKLAGLLAFRQDTLEPARAQLGRIVAALGSATTPAELAGNIARATAHLLQQPLAVVVTPAADRQSAVITAAYDREHNQPVAVGTLVLHHSPDVLAAFGRGEAPIWTPSDDEAELRRLALAAGHSEPAPLLTLPLRNAGGDLLASVMVMPAPESFPWPANAADRLAALGAQVVVGGAAYVDALAAKLAESPVPEFGIKGRKSRAGIPVKK